MAERDDDAELLRLYTDLEAAIKKAIGIAPAAPKPLQGEALQRLPEADAKVTEIVRRIKEMAERAENPNEPAAKCKLVREHRQG